MLHCYWAFLVAQMVKNLHAIHKTGVQALGWEDPLEKRLATQSSILAHPMDRGIWQAMVHKVIRVGHDQALNTFFFTFALLPCHRNEWCLCPTYGAESQH